VVMTGDGEHLTGAAAAVQRVVADFDLACSRFREDSELEALNRAGGRPRAVSPLLREAVRAGVRAAQLTDGDVDPTLGAAMIALGYDRDFSLGVDGRGAGAAESAVGAAPLARPLSLTAVAAWRAIVVDDDAGTVTIPAGIALDLGATAKALAADHAAAAAAHATGTGVLVSLGGDIAIAGPAPGAGWPIRVTDDHRSGLDAPGQTITIASGGLATSSVTVRRWRTDGALRHHLLDPASGRPADGPWRTVSVAAASCLDANIAATAAVVRGERAEAWLVGAGLPSRLVSGDGHTRHVAGWPQAGDDLAPASTEVAA
jgi:thiamine biosynthesis lipoprotein